MIEKDEFYSENNFEDEKNYEFSAKQRHDKHSRKKKQSDFDEYDLKTQMNDYYNEFDHKH